MGRKRAAPTYRVRHLPSNVDARETARLLVETAEALGPFDNIKVKSLAFSLNPYEKPPTKTATVEFTHQLSLFDDDGTEWTLPRGEGSLHRDILVDVHFLGFTPLNDPEPDLHALESVLSRALFALLAVY